MIKRDGANISIWQDIPAAYTIINALVTGTQYDVIIAGGGIAGVSTALLLQEAGFKCALLEANTLCFGTTGGTTAHLNTLMDTPYTVIAKNFGTENAALVAQAAKNALATIKSNIDKYNIDCGFEEAKAWLFSKDNKQSEELEDIRVASGEAGLTLAYTDRIPVPVDFEKAIEIEGQAKFHPVRYVYALAKAFESLGGIIIQNCRVKAAENTDPVVVQTNAGDFLCSWLVYATHIPPGLSLLNLRCAPYRSYAMAVRLKNDQYPEGLSYDMYDPYHYYRTQEIDSKLYLIAGGEDHKTAHVNNTDACFLRLESHIRTWFSVQEVAYRWSSQYFEPADGLPYIGHMPGQPGKILVATGFGGNGMTYSTVAARLLTDMITGVGTPYTELFDPNRIKPVAGFTNFVKENADVVKQYFTGLFSKEDLQGLSNLAPGEGRVVRFEKHSIALSKDDAHNLHAISPVCSHLKCTVAWNSTERSWDCPCHGARYDMDGKVFTGPANTDLEKMDL